MTPEMLKAHNYLSQISNLNYKVNAINEALAELESRNPANLKAMQFDTVKVQTSGGDPLANYVIAESKYKADLIATETAYKEAQQEAVNRITRLDNGARIEILTRRYVLNQQWAVIAKGVHYDIRTAQLLRNKALTEFYEANRDLWPRKTQ